MAVMKVGKARGIADGVWDAYWLGGSHDIMKWSTVLSCKDFKIHCGTLRQDLDQSWRSGSQLCLPGNFWGWYLEHETKLAEEKIQRDNSEVGKRKETYENIKILHLSRFPSWNEVGFYLGKVSRVCVCVCVCVCVFPTFSIWVTIKISIKKYSTKWFRKDVTSYLRRCNFTYFSK